MIVSDIVLEPLQYFADHLARRGASPETIEQYLHQVSRSGLDDEGLPRLDRLRSRALAPKTRRLILTVFRAYARFVDTVDSGAAAAFRTELDDIRLPAAIRKKVQAPLPRPVYDLLRERIDETGVISEPMRAELGIMANRGLRRGDVLRVTASEVRTALRTGVLAFQAKGERRMEFGVTSAWKKYVDLLADCFEKTDRRGVGKTVSSLIAKTTKAANMAVGRNLRRVALEIEDEIEDAGLLISDVRPHILRRTYATEFYQACGKDPVKLQSHMQWAQISTAMGYVDFVNREELDDVAENMLK